MAKKRDSKKGGSQQPTAAETPPPPPAETSERVKKDRRKGKPATVTTTTVTTESVELKTNFVAEIESDDDNDNLPYGLSDEDQGTSSSNSNQNSRSKSDRNKVLPEYEELFYKRPHINKRGSKENLMANDHAADEDGEFRQPVAQGVSLLQYYDQTVNYTREMLDQLSRQIRRHPMIAAKSYRFLHKGLGTKIRHQKIQAFISALMALTLIVLYLFCPLPSLHRVELSPTSPTMQENRSQPIAFDDTFDLPLQQHNHTQFKDNWARFSIVGISNYLCGNYNFNPVMDAMMPPGDELHNVRIFGSALFASLVLFILWLCATRLAEREIILDSGVAGQVTHSLLTIIAIPLAGSAFWALISLYFTQTMMVSSGVPNVSVGQEDIFKCVNKMSGGIKEMMTFSPIRELIVGAVGISVRIANLIWGTPIQALALHDRAGLSPEAMAPISVMWCLIIGTGIYYFITIVSSIYTIFHDNKMLSYQQRNGQVLDQELITIDLRSLPSFLPEVAATQNFVVTIILMFVALVLYVFGLPKMRVHEGEIFYIFLALIPFFRAIYNLILINQRKQKIPNPPRHFQYAIDEDVVYD